MFGHSHGGGQVYQLSERFSTNWNRDAIMGDAMPANRLKFTAYLDAVQKHQPFAETRPPKNTSFLYNFYQHGDLDSLLDTFAGMSIDDANINDDIELPGGVHNTNTVHDSAPNGIAELTEVKSALTDSLKTKVRR